MSGPLPGIRWDWDEYTGLDPFMAYVVERRELRTLLDGHAPLTVQIEDDGRTLLATADVLNGIRGAVAMRLDFPWDNASEPGGGSGFPTFFDWQEDGSNIIRGRYDEANNRLQVLRVTDEGTSTLNAPQAITTGKHTLVVAWDEDTLYVSFDGSPFVTAASVAAIEIEAEAADIGSRQGFDKAEADVIWLLTFAAVPTTAQLAAIHALGDLPYVDALRNMASARPVGMWIGEDPAGIKVVPKSWTTIATINDITRTWFTDYRPASGKPYEYAVRVTANVFGEPITSDRQDPPPADAVRWRGVALHDVIDPADFLILHGRETRVQPEQDREYVQARGRRERTAQYGERRDRRIELTPIPHAIDEHIEWQRIERFLALEQDAGRIYLLRPGHRPESYFVVIDEASRSDVLVLGESALTFQQVYFDESAG